MGAAPSSSREEGRVIPVMEAKEKKPSQLSGKNKKLPHNYEIIMKEADDAFKGIPHDSFLNKGVLLKHDTKVLYCSLRFDHILLHFI